MTKIFPFTVYLLSTVILVGLNACDKDDDNSVFSSSDVAISTTHSVKIYLSQANRGKYLVVFESGLGDDHSVWQDKKVAEEIAKKYDVIMYDRAGYGKSTIDGNARNIDRLRQELEIVIDKYAQGRKAILVGHSLGGLIIRDFAIKNSGKTAALYFIDPSHEDYNRPTPSQEDEIYNAFLSAYSGSFGGTKESRQLIEDLAYIKMQADLPNIPTVVITSMKQDANNNSADRANNMTRQDWYNAHKSMGNGLTDFTHIQTVNAGHYIMREEPNLVLTTFDLLTSKLP